MQNKYLRWYNSIISQAKSENRKKGTGEVYERHHITPKSLGGLNSKENLVLLTAKEHFVCHHLLTKFTKGKRKSKMMFAYNCFVFGYGFAEKKRSIKVTVRQYEQQKKLLSEYQKQNSALKTKGGNYWMIGKSKEEIQEINNKKGRSGIHNGFYGMVHTEDTKKKAVTTRRKNGNGDYHNGSNPFANPEVIKKAVANRELAGNNNMSIEIEVFGIRFKSISEVSRHYDVGYRRLVHAYHKNGVKEIEMLIAKGGKPCPLHID